MKRAHWLRRNPHTKIPRHHVCVATIPRQQTDDPSTLELAHWAMTVCEWGEGPAFALETHSGADPVDFWNDIELVLDPKRRTWVWLLQPRIDLPLLLFPTVIQSGQFTRRYWVWADPPIILEGAFRKRPVRMVGLANWLDADTPELCKLVHLVQADREAIMAGAWGPDIMAGHDANACARAVERLLRFVQANDLGHLRSTAGGQSLQSYRHKFLPGKILCHKNQAALDLERSAALGWPPDLVRVGEVNERVSVYDVNMLYPHVMASYPFPRKLLWHSESVTLEDLRKAQQTALLMARVKVNDYSRSYLITEQGKCRLARGEFSGVLVGPDLDSAMTRGKVLHCWEAAGYEGAGMFCEWADWIWERRQHYQANGDQVGAKLAKTLSVALWGSFAANLHRYVPAPDVEPVVQFGEWYHLPLHESVKVKYRAIGGVVDRLERRDEPDDSIPSIAVFAACYARTFMANIRQVAGEENVLYQVADSLHVTDPGRERLEKFGIVDPSRRGALKLVRESHRTIYLAANTLVQDGQLTAAGIYGAAELVRPGLYRWRLPRRLSSSIVLPPLGTVAAPEVERSVRSLSSADHQTE